METPSGGTAGARSAPLQPSASPRLRVHKSAAQTHGSGVRDMHDFGFFSYDSKEQFLERSKAYWNPGKTQAWEDFGVDIVIGRREGYFIYDMSGKRLINLHLNGGTFNFGHRHPELVDALNRASELLDVGNHHFPALARTALAEALVKTCADNMRYVMYGSGGGEAIDIAIKAAR